MSGIDRPPQGSAEDPELADIAARLRSTLQHVATTTVVPAPTGPYTSTIERGPVPKTNRSAVVWRALGAAAVVLLIVAGVAALRSGLRSTPVDPVGPIEATTTTLADPTAAPSSARNDHWHAAYGVYHCDRFLTPFVDATTEDPLGIHTHGEGVIHVHPWVPSSSGRNATLALFAEQVGMAAAPGELRVPTAEKVLRTDRCGDTPASLVVATWNVDDPSAPPTIVTTDDLGRIRFTHDRMAITIAIVPAGVTPPMPPTVDELDNLTDVPPANGP